MLSTSGFLCIQCQRKVLVCLHHTRPTTSERSGKQRQRERINNNNNLKNHVEQSIRISAFFILLCHGDNFHSQQISSLDAPGKKLV